MAFKVRPYGEFPKGHIYHSLYHCENCGRHDRTTEIGNGLLQCPLCGRWVCEGCFNAEKGVCIPCTKYVYAAPKLKEIEDRLKQIENAVENLKFKVDSIKFCLNCGAPILAKAKYCGICGKKLKD
ncbi:MAG: zinc-ribbon domain-containing protein [Nitrososphaeria archaeon]